MQELFKKYDIRGLITKGFAKRIGNKLASKYGSIAIITDTKNSSKELAKSFAQGVIESGNNALMYGVGPTDMSSFISMKNKIFSVMFTASHLSENLDGMKFHDKEGKPFTSEMVQELKSLPEKKAINKGLIIKKDFKKQYFNRLIERYRELFNHDLTGLRINVKTMNGSSVSQELLKQLGAEVEVNSQRNDFDLIIEHDFDADRVKVIINEEEVNGSLIACLLTKKYKGLIIASIDTLSVLNNYSKVKHSRVGDPFIIQSIINNKAVLGVEPSGHYTDPAFTLTSSGTLFALIIAGLTYEESLKEQLSKLPLINVERTSIKVNDKNLFMKQLKKIIKNIESTIDGIKFTFNNSTVLIRPSGTESVIRLQLENTKKENNLVNLMNLIKGVSN